MVHSKWFFKTYMTRVQNKFINPKKGKGGNVTFGDNVTTKIVGKGKFSLGIEKYKVENVLLVEDLKNSILSIRKMCDQGQTCTLNSQECEIRQESLRRPWSSSYSHISTTPAATSEMKELKPCTTSVSDAGASNPHDMIGDLGN